MLLPGMIPSLVARAVLRARRCAGDDRGATVVEYGLLVALITVVVMAALTVLGVRINAMFCSVVTTLGGTC